MRAAARARIARGPTEKSRNTGIKGSIAGRRNCARTAGISAMARSRDPSRNKTLAQKMSAGFMARLGS
jgi:hypothetical protein